MTPGLTNKAFYFQFEEKGTPWIWKYLYNLDWLIHIFLVCQKFVLEMSREPISCTLLRIVSEISHSPLKHIISISYSNKHDYGFDP